MITGTLSLLGSNDLQKYANEINKSNSINPEQNQTESQFNSAILKKSQKNKEIEDNWIAKVNNYENIRIASVLVLKSSHSAVVLYTYKCFSLLQIYIHMHTDSQKHKKQTPTYKPHMHAPHTHIQTHTHTHTHTKTPTQSSKAHSSPFHLSLPIN